jgi:hypothetical protein
MAFPTFSGSPHWLSSSRITTTSLCAEAISSRPVMVVFQVRPKAFGGPQIELSVSSTEHLDIFRKIHVYLVNNTDTAYPKAKRLTGAFSSFDEDLMETGKRMTDMAALAAHPSQSSKARTPASSTSSSGTRST